MKIVFFEIEGWEKEQLQQAFPDAEVILKEEPINAEHLPEENDYEVISVFVDSKITEEVLANFPQLKHVTTRTTGFNHIDLEACKKRNISVSYVPGYGDNTVAEYAFGLILNLTRKIYHSIDQIKETGSFSLEGHRGEDLKGKTLGVIGTGRIGREVARIAHGFGLAINASDPMPDEKFARHYGVRYLPLEELLANSNIISIHCPYNQNTHHLINKENIKLIKKGAYIINTARGSIIDTEALVGALEDGTLAGAGLDVLEEEGEIKDELHFLKEEHPKKEELRTLLENHLLMKMPNVLITPHNAFNSQEAIERIIVTTIDNIQGFLRGAPTNLVPEESS